MLRSTKGVCARLFNSSMAPGTAMLLMTRVGYTADNTPIEITDTYCRNDYYDFVAELRRYDFAAELRP